MGDVVSGIADAVGGAVGAVSDAVSSVTDGIGAAVGGISDAIGLPSEIGDALESFTDIAAPIGLGFLTGGIGGLGIVGDLGGMLSPAGFLGDIGEAVGGFSDLLPGLGDVLGNLGNPAFNFFDPLQDFLGGIGSQGLVGDFLGPQGPLGFLEGSLTSLPGIMTGAGSVLGNIFNQIPQLGSLLGTGDPLGILSNLPGLTKNFKPGDVLDALGNGLGQLMNMFPSPSNILSDVMGMIQDVRKGFGDPSSILKQISDLLPKVPELTHPVAPFDPGTLLRTPDFIRQFAQANFPSLTLDANSIRNIGAGITGPLMTTLPFFFPPGTVLPSDPNVHIATSAGTSIQVQGGMQVTVNPNGSLTINAQGQPQGTGGVPGGAESSVSPDSPAGTQAKGEAGLTNSYERNMDTMDSLMDEISNLDTSTPDGQKRMFQIQQQMQKLQEMQSMILEMLKQQHDLRMQVIKSMQ